MTLRAVVLGVLLGLGVAVFTHFNDRVIVQSMLVGNHLPPAVFGLAVVLLLGINPLLRRFGSRWPLGAAELAVVVLMGLAVCGWPGSNFFRHFMHVMAMPSYHAQTQPAWQQQEVFSYVPGGSPRLAEGYIADWPVLIDALIRADADDAPPLLRSIHASLDEPGHRALVLAGDHPTDRSLHRPILLALNRALTQRDLISHEQLLAMDLPARVGPLLDQFESLDAVDRLALHRAALESVTGEAIRPPPPGAGVLLATDRFDSPAVEGMLLGQDQVMRPSVTGLPWSDWWPVLRLWGGMGLLLGLGCLFMVMIVHPQWMRHELLPYPTVRFLDELSRRVQDRGLPDIAYVKLFWVGAMVAGGIHLLNGLQVWFDALPHIPLNLNLGQLRQLFPIASRTPNAWAVFTPPIYLSVIGFGFFVTARVAFSLGVSALLWMIVAASALAVGASFTSDRFSVGGEGSTLRFGAYVGTMLMILYFGRRFYVQALRGAIGLGHAAVPASAVWGVRGLFVCFSGCVIMIHHYASLDWPLALVLVVMLFTVMLVLTRVNVETGLFFAQPDWLPGVILLGFLGAGGLGPEAMIVLTLAGVVLVGAPREAIMPYLANAWAAGDRIGGLRAPRSASLIGSMLVLGFVAALLATFMIHYSGVTTIDTWPSHMAAGSFHNLARINAELAADADLVRATGQSAWEGLRNARPHPGMIGWTVLGVLLVVGCALIGLRFPRWPLHPVVFVVWGTYPMSHFAFSFLLAGTLKWAVIACGGEKGYHHFKPLMIGLIVGELLMILLWGVVGGVYYFSTGYIPQVYNIAPP